MKDILNDLSKCIVVIRAAGINSNIVIGISVIFTYDV